MKIFDMYDRMKSEFSNISDNTTNTREIVSGYFCCTFDDSINAIKESTEFYNSVANDVLNKRKINEVNFHNYLKNQLLCRLHEIKAYSEVNIMDTRRMVAVSHECISSIQILIRDEIHVNVYMRSSDFDGALPVDLLFLSSLPAELIIHLEKFKGNPGYNEVNDNVILEITKKKVHLNINFGSLHRTI